MNTFTKRLLSVLALTVVMTVALAAESVPSPLYVKIFYIDRVATHQLGYKIDYRTASGKSATTYIPLTWFGGTSAKAEVVKEDHPSVPYVEYYFKEGKFFFTRLHLPASAQHPCWTGIRHTADLTAKFNVEAPVLVY